MNKKIFALIALILSMSLILGFAGCAQEESEEETTTVINVLDVLPTQPTTSVDEESGEIITDTEYSPEAAAANTQTIFEYFNLHVNALKDKKAAVTMSEGKNIGKSTYIDENGEEQSKPYCENATLAASVNTLKKYMLHTSDSEAAYGDDLVSYLPVSGQKWVTALTLEDVESATCVDEGTTRTITVNLVSPIDSAALSKAFELGSLEDALVEFEKANEYLTVADASLEYVNCQIIIIANVETNEISSIRYIKRADVTANVTGAGTIADLGTQEVCFRYEQTREYNFNYEDPNAPTTAAE